MRFSLHGSCLGLMALGTALVVPGLVSSQAVAASDPSHNTVPGRHFMGACFRVGTSTGAQHRCDVAALRAYDRVRAREGIGPLTLPRGFDTMPPAEQLLVISDLERVDRGLRPVAARVTQLDSLAANGARANADPQTPNPMPAGASATSLWAGAGTSTLLTNFFWMYDDGPGSGNIDCSRPGDPGCWGHRRGILTPFQAPVYMGAASVGSSRFGASIAEEFVGGGQSETTSYTPTGLSWAQLISRIPVGVGRAAVAIKSDPRHRHGTPLRVWASGVRMTVHLAVTSGRQAWSVTPSSCTLGAGQGCTVVVGYLPTSTAPTRGVLQVSGPGGTRLVHLRGHQATPTVSLSPASRTVAARRHANLDTRVRTRFSHRDRPGVRVELQRRKPGHRLWQVIARRVTGPLGGAHFAPKPTHSADYRVLAPATGGYPTATSRTVVVRVG